MPAAIPGHMTGYGYDYSLGASGSASPNETATMGGKATVIDGTPANVAAIGVLALAVVVGLRWAGIRFNVAASGGLR